jgi:hypothetical protein
MAHMYWTFACKTPDCGKRHDWSYIGDITEGQTFGRAFQPSFDFPCDACGKTYTYNHQDLKLFPRAHPPRPSE